MVTLKEYEAYLKVKKFIDGHEGSGGPGASLREAEIISRLINESNYVPLTIESDGTDPIKCYSNQQLLNIVGLLNKHWIMPIGIGVQE